MIPAQLGVKGMSIGPGHLVLMTNSTVGRARSDPDIATNHQEGVVAVAPGPAGPVGVG